MSEPSELMIVTLFKPNFILLNNVVFIFIYKNIYCCRVRVGASNYQFCRVRLSQGLGALKTNVYYSVVRVGAFKSNNYYRWVHRRV